MPDQVGTVTWSRPQKRRNFPRSLLAKLLRKHLEQLLAVEHSDRSPVIGHLMFESGEDQAMQPEVDSKP